MPLSFELTRFLSSKHTALKLSEIRISAMKILTLLTPSRNFGLGIYVCTCNFPAERDGKMIHK
jgi:hypothetical protein